MERRVQTYIRYAPLLLLCAFPHQIFLMGAMDGAAGVFIAPYAFVPALAFPIGAGIVIHIGEELFTQKACLNLYKVQLALSVALIALGCLYPILLYRCCADEFFYYLYPLQQAALFASHALTPAVHACACHAKRDPCAQGPNRGVARDLFGWTCDYRICAMIEAFITSLLAVACLLLPWSAYRFIGSWPSLAIAVFVQLMLGTYVVTRLAGADGSWVDSRFWAVWPLRFIGSVAAWPIAVVAFGCDAREDVAWIAVLGACFVISRLRFRHLVASGDASCIELRSRSDVAAEQYPVSVMAHRLEHTFPDVVLADREKHCIEMALAGMTSAQIAEELGIKPATVRSYLVRAYRKLGVSDLKALARHMRDAGRHLDKESDESAPPVMDVREGRACRFFFCLTSDARGLVALLLLMVILSDSGLSNGQLSFAVACAVIVGVTICAIGGGSPFAPRMKATHIVFGAVELCSIPLFRFLVFDLTPVIRIPLSRYMAILLCAFLFVPYLLHIALSEGDENPCGEPGVRRRLFLAHLVFGIAFLLVISIAPWVREIAFPVLFLFVCVDRIGALRVRASQIKMREPPGDASHLHTYLFIPFFMAGVVVGVCAQTALRIGAELGADVMLALPLSLLAVGCCLYLRRRGCVGNWHGGAVALGAVAAIAVGYWFEGSARLGTACVLLVLWATVACFRDSPSWRATVHALMFGVAAGASMSLIEFEVRFVMIRGLRGLDGVLPAAFDIEFRSLILVGLLVACALCALYELRTVSLEDAPPLPEDAFRRILSYCHGRGLSELQGLVIGHIILGESSRQIALCVGYSVGSVNSARLSAYKLLKVHTRDELIELFQRELGLTLAHGPQ